MIEFERRDTPARADAPLELRASPTGGPGLLVHYPVTFERFSKNLGGFVERVASTAFDRILDTSMPVALHNHDANRQLGSRESGTLTLVKDATGLRSEIDLPDTTVGRDVAELVKRGDLRGSSFGFQLVRRADGQRAETWTKTPEGFPLRTLDEIAHVRDVGPVTFPAYPSTAELGIALRSLAENLGRPLNDLVDACGRNELRSLLDAGADNEGEGGTSEPPTGLDLDTLRRRANARWRRVPNS